MEKIFFILSVDTEEEWDWRKDFPRNSFSTRNGHQIGKFQKFCEQIGIRPTYFVDYAIADDPHSVQHLLKPLSENSCEIGAHLHPWCTPPVIEEKTYANSYIINLPIDLLKRKLHTLTEKITKTFGDPPRSFRSGRWGMNGRILSLLAQNGYTVDSSIYPYYQDNGFNYCQVPDTPFWPDFKCCTHPGSQRMLFEIPVSSGFNRGNFPTGQKIHFLLSRKPFSILHPLGILSRLGIFYKVQLSPEPATAKEMIACAHSCVKNGHNILHMFFHSSSLLLHGNPYVTSEEAVNTIYNRIEQTVRTLATHYEIVPVTLQEAYHLLLPTHGG